jgi:hypothetical protein
MNKIQALILSLSIGLTILAQNSYARKIETEAIIFSNTVTFASNVTGAVSAWNASTVLSSSPTVTVSYANGPYQSFMLTNNAVISINTNSMPYTGWSEFRLGFNASNFSITFDPTYFSMGSVTSVPSHAWVSYRATRGPNQLLWGLEEVGARRQFTFPFAEGGVVTTNGGLIYHAFLTGSSTTTQIVFNRAGTLSNVMVIAQGGGGGNGLAGGGGAGGVIYSNGFVVTPGTYTIFIDNRGGAGAGTSMNSAAIPGSNAVFGPLTAIGGGRGGSYQTTNPTRGGSGGGGQNQYAGAGSGTSGQGYAGGNGGPASSPYTGGGGGGAGSVGLAGQTGIGGNGGSGVYYSVYSSWGQSNGWFAGGGGGGVWNTPSTPGVGGLGGGGNGKNAGPGDNGLVNTGGGGGSGGGVYGGGGTGAIGGVWICYPTTN